MIQKFDFLLTFEAKYGIIMARGVNMGKKQKKSTVALLNDPKYRKNNQMMRITKKEYVRRMKITVGTTAVIAAIAGGFAKEGFNFMSRQRLLTNEIVEFHGDVINPNTHRTLDKQNYFYDYAYIAQAIMTSDDVERNVFLAYRNFHSPRIDDVLKYTPYKTFEGFLSEYGYQNEEQFNDLMSEQVMLEEMIEQQEKEIEKIKMKKYTHSN